MSTFQAYIENGRCWCYGSPHMPGIDGGCVHHKERPTGAQVSTPTTSEYTFRFQDRIDLAGYVREIIPNTLWSIVWGFGTQGFIVHTPEDMYIGVYENEMTHSRFQTTPEPTRAGAMDALLVWGNWDTIVYTMAQENSHVR